MDCVGKHFLRSSAILGISRHLTCATEGLLFLWAISHAPASSPASTAVIPLIPRIPPTPAAPPPLRTLLWDVCPFWVLLQACHALPSNSRIKSASVRVSASSTEKTFSLESVLPTAHSVTTRLSFAAASESSP